MEEYEDIDGDIFNASNICDMPNATATIREYKQEILS